MQNLGSALFDGEAELRVPDDARPWRCNNVIELVNLRLEPWASCPRDIPHFALSVCDNNGSSSVTQQKMRHVYYDAGSTAARAGRVHPKWFEH